MDNILGVDYGRRKIGLAIADAKAKLAMPLKVVRYEKFKEGIEKVSKVAEVSGVSKVVIGISEGKMAEETKIFGRKLEEKLHIQIEFQDETLTTYEAQELSIKAGIKRKKRRLLEDAYSAALILQEYLTSVH